MAGQVKNAATVTLGKMLQSKDSGSDVRAPYMRAANVQPDGLLALDDVNEMWFGEHELEQLSIRAGDVVVVEGGQGGFGRAAYVDQDLPGWGFQNSINRLRPIGDFDGRFIAFYLIALRASGFIRAYSNVVSMPHLTAEKLARIPIPLPPVEVQRAIADYLDCETVRIDTLIKEQQRLIEMLLERRESAIRTVLLRGLDDDAPLRASGSEFLGLIPSAWTIVPTRHLCTITTGDEDSGNASDDGAYPFYVRGREILRSDTYAFDGEAVMTPGDGQGGTGKVFHYFDGKFQAHQRVYVFTDFHGITGRYFYYYLSTFLRPIALAGSNTVTMESLRRPLLASFPVAVPPADEQTVIVERLDEQITKIDQLIAETDKFIKLSQERRTAIITAAVTGQIDVPEVA
ncbi:restriction endonuclease subunit S [Streptomyces sp. H51]|uniref:restriction endonuclease subunit S n=1 Tax=Streptomyces sp. H51 TaxID=3111770 RepID=UPI002D7862CD|nr:restriction endonuclease subunit S [Streptomyces sp. H51]